MASLSSRKAIAPSSALLKFLRAQDLGQCFFTPSRVAATRSASSSSSPSSSSPAWRVAVQNVSSPRAAPAAASPTCTRKTRQMTTFAPIAHLETSLSVGDSLWPRRPTPQDPPPYFSKNDVPITTEHPLKFLAAIGKPVVSIRTASTDGSCGQSGWWRFWKAKRFNQRQRPELHPNDLPPIDGFMDDGVSFGRTLRPVNELRIRCTEFDENGNITLVNGEFKKSELTAKYGLLPRDLRKVDSSLLPNILVRESAILINLLNLRVLIKHDRVLVFDAYGSTDTYAQSRFMYDLEGKLRSIESRPTAAGHLPYEFRALESVLISTTTNLEAEFEGVRGPVMRVLRELEEDIDRDKLRYLLIYSKKLSSFEQKARLVRNAIDDLLEADDDLAAMYLTEKASGKQRQEQDHTEVEMLLESYYKVCDEIVEQSSNLVNNIRNTEEIVKAILDANRNSLMLLDLKFSVGTLGIGAGTFVAALYGMNLKNFIEESDLGFIGVSVWCTIFSIVVFYYGLKKLRSIQRVSMWGGGGGDSSHAGHRAHNAMLSAFPHRDRHRLAKDAQQQQQQQQQQPLVSGLDQPLPPLPHTSPNLPVTPNTSKRPKKK